MRAPAPSLKFFGSDKISCFIRCEFARGKGDRSGFLTAPFGPRIACDLDRGSRDFFH